MSEGTFSLNEPKGSSEARPTFNELHMKSIWSETSSHVMMSPTAIYLQAKVNRMTSRLRFSMRVWNRQIQESPEELICWSINVRIKIWAIKMTFKMRHFQHLTSFRHKRCHTVQECWELHHFLSHCNTKTHIYTLPTIFYSALQDKFICWLDLLTCRQDILLLPPLRAEWWCMCSNSLPESLWQLLGNLRTRTRS